MVLADLGGQISSALQNLQNSTVIDEKVLNDLLNTIARALMQADVNFALVKKIKTQILNEVKLDDLASGINKRRAIQKAVFDNLVGLVSPSKTPYKPKKGKCNVVMFVGLQGSGKTTSIAKYAQWYKMKNWSCGMVCADTFRAGAFDQLKQNATRIKVPFYGSYTEADPVVIAKEGVEQFKKQGFEMIIVDTSGRHKQSDDLFEEMVRVKDAVQPDEIIFVMDSTIGQAAKDQAQAFSDSVEVGSVIITKLDGHAKGGGALSAVAMTGSPIVFIGTGEHFDDFEPFEARSFIKRLLGMGDLESLADELKAKGSFPFGLFRSRFFFLSSSNLATAAVVPCRASSRALCVSLARSLRTPPPPYRTHAPAGIFDQNPDMMKRMVQGLFSFRDMYQQFEQVKSLGPLGRVMSMIPGLPQGLMQKGQEREGQERIERFMYMMNSMNELELDGINDIDRSRAERIARGSGCNLLEVGMLLQSHAKVGPSFLRARTHARRCGDGCVASLFHRCCAAPFLTRCAIPLAWCVPRVLVPLSNKDPLVLLPRVSCADGSNGWELGQEQAPQQDGHERRQVAPAAEAQPSSCHAKTCQVHGPIDVAEHRWPAERGENDAADGRRRRRRRRRRARRNDAKPGRRWWHAGYECDDEQDGQRNERQAYEAAVKSERERDRETNKLINGSAHNLVKLKSDFSMDCRCSPKR